MARYTMTFSTLPEMERILKSGGEYTIFLGGKHIELSWRNERQEFVVEDFGESNPTYFSAHEALLDAVVEVLSLLGNVSIEIPDTQGGE